MRNLDFTSDSPQSIKLGDSSDVLSLQVTESDKPVDLSKVSLITVKIGNTLGFLTEINVDVSSLLHPTDGIIDVVISSKFSSKLPAGQYLLEVWIDDAQGNTVIYPDTSYPTVIGFSIKKNIMAETSTVISTLTLADFKTKFDEMQEDLQYKAASGYFKGLKGDKGDVGATGPQGLKGDKGDKGDTGTVDNTGLINSKAFQSLQTQVNNSAVGTNLLTGTQDWQGEWKNLSSWSVSEEKYEGLAVQYGSTAWKGLGQYYDAKPNTTYTFSFYAKAFEASNFLNIFTLSSENWSSPVVSPPVFKNQAIATEWQRYSVTFTTKSGGAIYPSVCSSKDGATIYVAGYKLEKGSVATDRCPNPSEILTQSDYAKIKAAIVALGGALS